MAELHGGTLAIESTPDVGTKVIVTLPADRMVTPKASLSVIALQDRRRVAGAV